MITITLQAKRPGQDWGIRNRCYDMEEARRLKAGWEACEPWTEYQIEEVEQ